MRYYIWGADIVVVADFKTIYTKKINISGGSYSHTLCRNILDYFDKVKYQPSSGIIYMYNDYGWIRYNLCMESRGRYGRANDDG